MLNEYISGGLNGSANGGVSGGTNGGTNGGLNGGTNGGLNKQNQIIEIIKNNPYITIKQMSEQTRIPIRTLEREIRGMRNSVIKRVGPKKFGYWVIIE